MKKSGSNSGGKPDILNAIALLESILASTLAMASSRNIQVLASVFLKDGAMTGFFTDKSSGLIFEFCVHEDVKYAAYLGHNNPWLLWATSSDAIAERWRIASDSYNNKCQCNRNRNDSTQVKKRQCDQLPCGNSCISTKYSCHLKGSKLDKKSATRLKSLNYIAKKIQKGKPQNVGLSPSRKVNLPTLKLNPQNQTIIKEIAKNKLSVGAIASSVDVPANKLAQALTTLAENGSPADIANQLQIPEDKIAEIIEQIAPSMIQSDPNNAIQKALQENEFDRPYEQNGEDDEDSSDDGEESDEDEGRKQRKDSNTKSIPCGDSFISARYTCRQKHTKKRLSNSAKRSIKKGYHRYLNTKNVSKIPAFKRYENNLKRTGKTLKSDPSQIENMKLGKYAEKPRKTDKEQLTFFLAGLSDNEAEVDAGYRVFSRQFEREGFSGKSELFSMTQEKTTRGKFSAVLNVAGGHISKGKNPDAEKIAKHILEWKQKNPDAKINLLGHSGGGLTAKDVAYILNEAGVDNKDIKTLTLGTPYLDVYKNQNSTKNIVNKDDIYNTVPVKNERLEEISDRPKIDKDLQNSYLRHSISSYASPYFKTKNGKYIKNPAYEKVTSEMRDFFEF